VNPATGRCLKKLFKTLLIEGFFHLRQMSFIPPVVHLEAANIFANFPSKFEMFLNYIIRARGKMIHEITSSEKSCDTVPARPQPVNISAYRISEA
jgi:hypothetical protein